MSLKAPWTPDQVEALNVYQRLGYVHEFTCSNRGDGNHRDEGALVATVHGWICPYCDYAQDWAHEGMADKSRHPPNPLDLLRKQQ